MYDNNTAVLLKWNVDELCGQRFATPLPEGELSRTDTSEFSLTCLRR